MPRKHQKNYYAVVKGRIDEPTIYSSWGMAHPKVTGCTAVHKGFLTLQAARDYMKENNVTEYKEVIQGMSDDIKLERRDTGFYAEANGVSPGTIEKTFERVKADTDRYSGACHKRFRTEAQAEAFNEEWKKSYADVCRREVKLALDQGLKPRDMKVRSKDLFLFGISRSRSTLEGHDNEAELAEIMGALQLKG